MRTLKYLALAFAAVAGLFCLAAPAEAQIMIGPQDDHDRIRASGFVWRGALEGEIEVEEIESVSGTVDVGEALGLGETQNGFIFELNAAAGKRHRFLFDYVGLESTADTRLTIEIIVDGIPISIDEPIASTVKLRELRGLYNFLFVARPSAEVGVLAGVGHFRIEAGVDTRLADATADLDTPYPVIGGNLMINPGGAVRAYAELSGFPEVNVDDFSGRLIDLQARLELFPIDSVGFVVGYRSYRLDFEDTGENLFFDVSWDGLFFGGQLRY